jgi:hypothetical protein
MQFGYGYRNYLKYNIFVISSMIVYACCFTFFVFQVFDAEIDNEKSRRLAACWYYTATEVDFSNEDEVIIIMLLLCIDEKNNKKTNNLC